MRNPVLLPTTALLLATVPLLAACASSGKHSGGAASTSSSSSGSSAGAAGGKPSASSSTASGKSSSAKSGSSGDGADVVAMDYAIGEIRLGDGVPEKFSNALRGYLRDALAADGRLAAAGAANRIVTVELSDYHLRGSVARALGSVLGQSDRVAARVLIADTRGKLVGESRVVTSNALAEGGDDALARAAALEISRFLSGAPLRR